VKKKKIEYKWWSESSARCRLRYEKSRYCSRFNWPAIAWQSIGAEQKRGGPDLIELNAPPDAAAHPEGERALIDKV